MGQAVRQTIRRIGGTMPEDLPTPAKSTKQIEKEKLLENTNYNIRGITKKYLTK